MNIFQFMDLHPILTWFLAWGVLFISIVVAKVALLIIARLIRSINVCARGWPPEHLDADGDFKPLPKEPE